MAGIISSHPLAALRILYNEAVREDALDAATSALWQSIFQTYFNIADGTYIVVADSSSGEKKKGAHITIRAAGYSQPSLLFVLVPEKNPKGAGRASRTSMVESAEKQATLYAKETLQKTGYPEIKVMTGWGSKFRLWTYSTQRVRLTSLLGQDTLACWPLYVDVDTAEAGWLDYFVNDIKDGTNSLWEAQNAPAQSGSSDDRLLAGGTSPSEQAQYGFFDGEQFAFPNFELDLYCGSYDGEAFRHMSAEYAGESESVYVQVDQAAHKYKEGTWEVTMPDGTKITTNQQSWLVTESGRAWKYHGKWYYASFTKKKASRSRKGRSKRKAISVK